ncbi:hypothetical protein Tco_1138868 [Tanacetum coccineum]
MIEPEVPLKRKYQVALDEDLARNIQAQLNAEIIEEERLESYDEIQKLFDKEMKRVNTFVAMSSEAQKSNEKKIEGSEEQAKSNRKKSLGKKRAAKEHQQESPKRQKLEDDKETNEHEEVKADNTAELKKHLVIKSDDDIAIDAITLATKPPMNVEYKLLKEVIMVHY